MATDNDLRKVLKRAAEAIAKREISSQELDAIIVLFNEAKGTNYERALEALGKFAEMTTRYIFEKTAASDNLSRVMQDLKNVIQQWKAGSK